jgi:CRISPR-associated exonuclease Cas4
VSFSIPVNLIRQWCYCPRIVYYIELTEFKVVYPGWVKQGERFHQKETELWRRRNLSRFSLEKGEIHLDYDAKSIKHQIHGIADMIIETDDTVHPVEFKLANSFQKKGGILQLVAYGMIMEESFQKKSPYGFLAEGEKNISKIEFTEILKKEVIKKIKQIKQMLNRGIKPDSSATIYQCVRCEYRNHCNDRG